MAPLCPELSPFSSFPLSISEQPYLHFFSHFFSLKRPSVDPLDKAWPCPHPHYFYGGSILHNKGNTQNKRLLTHPDCDSVVRHYFQVRQRGGTLGHSVELIYGCPQPCSVHVMQCERHAAQNKIRTGQHTTITTEGHCESRGARTRSRKGHKTVELVWRG